MRSSSGHLAFAAIAVSGWIAAAMAPAPTLRAERVDSLDAAIAEIEAGRRTTPLIGEPAAGGDVPVTFLARRTGRRVPRIVSDVTGWGERADGTFDTTVGTMTRVGRTHWYVLEASVAPRARIEYLIADGPGDYRLDPHNPRHVEPPPASEFITPGYEPPPELADPPVSPAGVLTGAIVESRALGGSCSVTVYTPPGDRDDRRYPVAVFLDPRARQVSRVLDWTIAHRAIQPIVAVFVESGARGGDRPAGPALREFLTQELPAWLSAGYAATRSVDERAIIAISYGAKDALDAAFAPGHAFARLGLLIPGRRIGPADIAAVTGRRDRRLRVAILAGQYDWANVATARGLREALAGAGHVAEYIEVPEGHSPRTWLNHLRALLVALFPAERISP